MGVMVKVAAETGRSGHSSHGKLAYFFLYLLIFLCKDVSLKLNSLKQTLEILLMLMILTKHYF